MSRADVSIISNAASAIYKCSKKVFLNNLQISSEEFFDTHDLPNSIDPQTSKFT